MDKLLHSKKTAASWIEMEIPPAVAGSRRRRDICGLPHRERSMVRMRGGDMVVESKNKGGVKLNAP